MRFPEFGCRPITWLGGALLATASALMWCAAGPRFLTSDGGQYLSVAENLHAGRGPATSIAFYEEHYRMGGIPVPQTMFPPGYPALAVIPMKFGASSAGGAWIVSGISFLLTAALLHDVARRRGHSRERALGVSAVWLSCVASWSNLLGALSEMPFTGCTVLAVWLLSRWRRLPAALCAGLAAAGAVAIRYQAVFFLPALAWMVLRRGRESAKSFVLAIGPPATMLLVLLVRNRWLVGDFKGGNDYELGLTVADVLRELYFAGAGVVGFHFSGLRALHPTQLALVAGAALALALVGSVSARRRPVSMVRLAHRTPLAAWAYLATSVSGLAYLELTKPVGLSARMLLPLLPFLLLVLLELERVLRNREAKARLGIAALLLSGAFAAGQLSAVTGPAFWSRPTRVAGLEASLRTPRVLEILTEESRAGRPVLSSEAQLLGALHPKQMLLGLTAAEYSGRIWLCDEVERLALAYRVRYVFFHGTLFKDSGNQTCLAALAAGVVPPWLQPELVSPEISVYSTRGRTVAGEVNPIF